jgi:hypothetical protein
LQGNLLMNNDERQILLEQSQILRDLLHHQMSAERSMRALFLALKTHFPKLAEEQHKAENDALFASPSTLELQRLLDRSNQIIEHLKSSA